MGPPLLKIFAWIKFHSEPIKIMKRRQANKPGQKSDIDKFWFFMHNGADD